MWTESINFAGQNRQVRSQRALFEMFKELWMFKEFKKFKEFKEFKEFKTIYNKNDYEH